MNRNDINIKEGTLPAKFLTLCEVDYETGISKIITADILKENGLDTKNGCSWGRSDGPLKQFNIDRIKKGNKIYSIQLVGYSKSKIHKSISPEIYKYFKNKNQRCKAIGVGGKNLEIDHKNGRKELYIDDKDPNNFQLLHKTVNDTKREFCKKCKDTGIRYDATQLGFSVAQWTGSKKWEGSCIGCLCHDYLEFYAQVSKNYKQGEVK